MPAVSDALLLNASDQAVARELRQQVVILEREIAELEQA